MGLTAVYIARIQCGMRHHEIWWNLFNFLFYTS